LAIKNINRQNKTTIFLKAQKTTAKNGNIVDYFIDNIFYLW